MTYAVTYTARMVNGEQHPRRVDHLGEEAANALARDLARRDNVSCVVVERWECVERKAVGG